MAPTRAVPYQLRRGVQLRAGRGTAEPLRALSKSLVGLMPAKAVKGAIIPGRCADRGPQCAARIDGGRCQRRLNLIPKRRILTLFGRTLGSS
jgi:hypothetical protein